MTEATPDLRIISSNVVPTVDETSLHGGKIRIVNSGEAMSPKKVISVNQQQFTISQGKINLRHEKKKGVLQFSYLCCVLGGNVANKPAVQEKPKVVIRPAIAPKTENKVQYVKVVGGKQVQQQQVCFTQDFHDYFLLSNPFPL